MNRPRTLVYLLGGLLAAGLVTLPWQLKQWRTLDAERARTAREEERLRATTEEEARLRQARQATTARADPAARLAAAATLVRNGDRRGALPLLAALEAAPGADAAQLSYLGDLYRQAGQVDRAFVLLTRAQKMAPRDPATQVRLGYLELSLGQRSAGLRHFRDAQKAAPDLPEPLLAEAFYQDQERDTRAAGRLLRQALSLRPQSWKIATLLADNQSKQGEHTAALSRLRELVQRYPAEPNILAQQVRSLLDAADAQPDRSQALRAEAVQTALQCLHLAPSDASVYFELGRAYQGQDDSARALAAWEQAYRIKPSYIRLRSRLGQLLLRQGQKERGQKLLSEESQAEDDRTAFAVESGKSVQAWGDPAARKRFALWCEQHHRISRARLEWERLRRDFPKDPQPPREVARLQAQPINSGR